MEPKKKKIARAAVHLRGRHGEGGHQGCVKRQSSWAWDVLRWGPSLEEIRARYFFPSPTLLTLVFLWSPDLLG